MGPTCSAAADQTEIMKPELSKKAAASKEDEQTTEAEAAEAPSKSAALNHDAAEEAAGKSTTLADKAEAPKTDEIPENHERKLVCS